MIYERSLISSNPFTTTLGLCSIQIFCIFSFAFRFKGVNCVVAQPDNIKAVKIMNFFIINSLSKHEVYSIINNQIECCFVWQYWPEIVVGFG